MIIGLRCYPLGFSTIKLLFFLFVVTSYLVGKYSEAMQMSLLLLTNVCIHFCLQLVLWCLPAYGDFHFPLFLLQELNYCKELSLLPLCLHLFGLFISEWTHKYFILWLVIHHRFDHWVLLQVGFCVLKTTSPLLFGALPYSMVPQDSPGSFYTFSPLDLEFLQI